METINRNDLKAKIDRGEQFVLVETLPEATFLESHLPGAIHLPPEELRELAPRVLPNKNAEIVVYGARSASNGFGKAARELAAMGYTHVKDYADGKQDWIDAGLPTESEWDEPTPPP